MTVVVNGYVSPLLVLFTVVTNGLVCLVLLRKHFRNATNSLLIAMAISDTLTGVLPLPCFLYFYTAGRYVEWMPRSWCFVFFCLTDYLPTVTHTASIWLTVTLAFQRYICVCRATTAKPAYTVRNILYGIGIIYLLAVSSHGIRFAELQFYDVRVTSLVDQLVEVDACAYDFAQFVQRHEKVYFNVYYWYRVIAIQLIPCAALVVLNALLVRTIQTAQRRRNQLRREGIRCKAECRRLSDSSSTTLMLVIVVGILLLVEIPMAVFLAVTLIENTFSVQIVNRDTTQVAALLVNVLVLLSYPLNFFVYCSMSQQFRLTFRHLGTSMTSAQRRAYHRRDTLGNETMTTENGLTPRPPTVNNVAETMCM